MQQSILSLSLCILYWDISDCKRKLWYRNKPETHPSNLFSPPDNFLLVEHNVLIIMFGILAVCFFKAIEVIDNTEVTKVIEVTEVNEVAEVTEVTEVTEVIEVTEVTELTISLRSVVTEVSGHRCY